jgi:signal transduction histidine kinase
MSVLSGGVLFFYLALRVLTYESTLLTSALTRTAFCTFLAGTVLSLAGVLALPAESGYTTVMFITGVYYGHFVPIHVWVLVLQTQKNKNNAMSSFIRYLSHEIRVPANVSLLALGEARVAMRDILRRHSEATLPSTHCELQAVAPAPAVLFGVPMPAQESSVALGSTTERCPQQQPLMTIARGGRAAAPSSLCDADRAPSQLACVHNGSFDPQASLASTLSVELPHGRLPSNPIDVDSSTTASDTRCIPREGSQLTPTHLHQLLIADENTSDALLALQGMKDLLDRTLDLARFESGMQTLVVERFDLAALLTALHRESAQGFKSAGVHLHWSVGGKLAGLQAKILPMQSRHERKLRDCKEAAAVTPLAPFSEAPVGGAPMGHKKLLALIQLRHCPPNYTTSSAE